MKTKLFTVLTVLFFSLTSFASNMKTANNPYISSDVYGITHIDPSQSDSFPYAIKKGIYNIDLSKSQFVNGGPINIITLYAPGKKYMWAINSQGVSYVDVKGKSFKEVAHLDYPGIKAIAQETHKKILSQDFTSMAQVNKAVEDIYGFDAKGAYTRITSGIYSVVDNNNVIYIAYEKNKLLAMSLVDKKDPSKGIKIVKSFDVNNISKGQTIIGISMTYDGNLVVLGERSVSVIDRNFKNFQNIVFGSDEFITNSMAIDDHNGIYIASDKLMHKVVWTGTKLSTSEKDGAWSESYDHGDQAPIIKIGTGTGSTPTLMGFGKNADKLVVITDGSNHMKLWAFWRDQIPGDAKLVKGAKTKRVAGIIETDCGLNTKDYPFIQSEQSVVVNGYDAFVVNNMPKGSEYSKKTSNVLAGVIALGPVVEAAKGAESVKWNPKTNTFKTKWKNTEVSSTSMVPTMSSKSKVVFVNGYNKNTGWELTGIDWKTGKVVSRYVFGKNNMGNGAYAIVQFFPNGDLLFNSISGSRRVEIK